MFPTCSNRILAGRNALSATDRTICSSGRRRHPAARRTRLFDGQHRRHPQPSGGLGAEPRRRPIGPDWAGETRAVVCSARLGGGDRHKGPPTAHAPRCTDGSSPRRGLLVLAWVSRRAAAAGRARTPTSRAAISRSTSSPRRSSRPTSGSRRPATCELEVKNVGNEQVPNLAVTICTGDEKAGGLVPGPLRPAGARRSQPPGVGAGERLPEAAHGGRRSAHPRSSSDRRGRRRADRHVRVRAGGAGRQQGHRLARDARGRRDVHDPLRARGRA